MADETVALTTLTEATACADLLTAAGTATVEVDAANVASIDCKGDTERVVFVCYENGGGAATVAPVRGDRPPAAWGDQTTATTITVGTGEVIAFCLDASKYIQDDGTIRLTVAAQNVHITALQIPKTV